MSAPTFSSGLCESAEGRVRATLSGEMAGIVLPGGLLGEARCADGALLLALASQSAMERADIRIFGDGRYRIDVIVRPGRPRRRRPPRRGRLRARRGRLCAATRRIVLTG